MKIHLAILHKPYIKKILNGQKTIESRFTKVKCLPYKKVSINDLILLKQQSGSVVAMARVFGVRYYERLNRKMISEILHKYGKLLALEPDFIPKILTSNYCSLIELKDIKRIEPMRIKMKGRSGWYILDPTIPKINSILDEINMVNREQ